MNTDDKKPKGLAKGLTILSLISSIFIIIVLATAFYFSLQYWVSNLTKPPIANKEKLWFVSLLVAVITAYAQWVEGRIKAISRDYRILKGGDILNAKKEED